jgi:hypothetical protein
MFVVGVSDDLALRRSATDGFAPLERVTFFLPYYKHFAPSGAKNKVLVLFGLTFRLTFLTYSITPNTLIVIPLSIFQLSEATNDILET